MNLFICRHYIFIITRNKNILQYNIMDFSDAFDCCMRKYTNYLNKKICLGVDY